MKRGHLSQEGEKCLDPLEGNGKTPKLIGLRVESQEEAAFEVKGSRAGPHRQK
jgi:hypothetical protein